MTPREQIVAMLRMRGSATQKQLLAIGGPRRRTAFDLVTEERAAVLLAIKELLAEGLIEIVSQRAVIYGGTEVGTRTRYRLAGGSR